MDMPIYLQFIDGDVRGGHRWYVIEEKEAAADVLGEERWVLKSDQDRVRVLNLPKLERDDGIRIDKNGILYIDLQQPNPKSWERLEIPDYTYVRGAAVSDNGDGIYAVADGMVLHFNCRLVDNPEVFLPLHGNLPRYLLAAAGSGSKMLLYSPPRRGISGNLGFCDVKSRSWKMIHSFSFDTDPFADWFRWSTTGVLVEDSFLIVFGRCLPWTTEYRPALYVYDIRRMEWLPKPVQGLANNSIVLPDLNDLWPFSYSALMQVRRDELKLGLVWSIPSDDDAVQTQVHWSKFILRIDKNDDGQDIPPTFHAQGLSSGTCYGGNTYLIRSTVGG
ncbi:hypothetical protein ACLB2K_061499 [Fragaria x ananassa]